VATPKNTDNCPAYGARAYFLDPVSNDWLPHLGNSSGASLITPTQVGIVSDANSTMIALSACAVFSGAYTNISDYASISIISTADVSSTLWADFSIDGTTVDRSVQLSNGKDGAHGIHSLIPISKFFKTRVVNAGADMASLRTQTILNKNSRISQPTSRLGQNIGQYSDTINARVANDFKLDTSRGIIGERSAIQKFGANTDVPASTTEGIAIDGVMPFLTTATRVRVKSGGNTADTAGGLGAQTILLEGLDASFNIITETLTTNGDSASVSSSQSFIRMYRAKVANVGTYAGISTGANTGKITIENASGGTDILVIAATHGQSETTQYTIPSGKTGYLEDLFAFVATAKPMDLVMYKRENADDILTPFTGKQGFLHLTGITGETEEKFESYVQLPEKTDIWLEAENGTGGIGSCGARYELILIDNV